MRGHGLSGNTPRLGVPLVAPPCLLPRDYLSDTPLLRAVGFWYLSMANWVRCPLPLFSAFPPWRACEVEVRYPPPPTKRSISAILARYPLKTRQDAVRCPPLRYYLERVLRDMGGVAKAVPHLTFPLKSMLAILSCLSSV